MHLSSSGSGLNVLFATRDIHIAGTTNQILASGKSASLSGKEGRRTSNDNELHIMS